MSKNARVAPDEIIEIWVRKADFKLLIGTWTVVFTLPTCAFALDYLISKLVRCDLEDSNHAQAIILLANKKPNAKKVPLTTVDIVVFWIVLCPSGWCNTLR